MRAKLVTAGLLALTLTGCAVNDQIYGADVGYDGGYYDDGYYGDGNYGYGYQPYPGVFYGSIFIGGLWYDGPHRYRDGRRGREFWFRDRWHRAQMRPGNDGRGPRNGFGQGQNQGQWQDRGPQGTGNSVAPPPRNRERGNTLGNRPRADANAQTAAPNPPPVTREPRNRGNASPRAHGPVAAAAAAIRERERQDER